VGSLAPEMHSWTVHDSALLRFQHLEGGCPIPVNISMGKQSDRGYQLVKYRSLGHHTATGTSLSSLEVS
jgi:hypothetical protein